jgi:hypothetical protein
MLRRDRSARRLLLSSAPVWIVSPPAVAKGAIGAEAELYYLDTNVFTVYSARMTNGAWGAASFAGTASARLAIATGK